MDQTRSVNHFCDFSESSMLWPYIPIAENQILNQSSTTMEYSVGLSPLTATTHSTLNARFALDV
jgi:hypothetical protein